MRNCLQCSREWNEDKDVCSFCGAPSTLSIIEKHSTFFYGKYLIHVTKDINAKNFTFHVCKVVGRVEFLDSELKELSPHVDIAKMTMERAGL